MNNLIDNLHYIQQQIRDAALAAQRDPNDIQLLAVSKKQLAQDIKTLFEAGQRCFGENYLQEALDKIKVLADLKIEWHFIGRLQANKTRPIAEHFHWVHTVDRPSIATRLNEQRPAHLPPLQICIQVNLAEEQQKAGIAATEVLSLAQHIQQLPRLQLRGLMTLPCTS